jgi:hypothetical protein
MNGLWLLPSRVSLRREFILSYIPMGMVVSNMLRRLSFHEYHLPLFHGSCEPKLRRANLAALNSQAANLLLTKAGRE